MTAKKAIDRLVRIIQDHLDISKIEAGKMDYEIELHEVSETVSYVIHLLSGQLEEKRIRLMCLRGVRPVEQASVLRL